MHTNKRICSLAIPPAWRNVWISPNPASRLQATGIDARGRKQYLYHPTWRAKREHAKYLHIIPFAESLPRIRRCVKRDLSRRGLPKPKVLATIVRLLEETLIRVGNEEYVKQNKSYGLTTLRDGQTRVTGETLEFRFRGKSGKHHHIVLRDRTAAIVVRKCKGLPGSELFQYLDNRGNRHDVSSDEVNAYLRAIAGLDCSAKNFRTWAGTVNAAMELSRRGTARSKTEAKRNVADAIRMVSRKLGNTPVVCRKSYVHPFILDSYLKNGSLPSLLSDEESVLKLLRDCI